MRNHQNRHGVALLIVLVLIVMISLGAYTFTDRMTAEERGTIMAGRRAQAQAGVASGVEYIKDYLALLPEDRVALGGHWDNAAYFQNVLVSDDLTSSLRFSILSITQDTYGEPTGLRYGLEDQGAKININTLATSDLYKNQDAAGGGDAGGREDVVGGDDPGAGGDPEVDGDSGTGDAGQGADGSVEGGLQLDDPQRNVLMMLPGMTEEIADSILDWIDTDDEPRAFGAEGDMYGTMLGYEPTNGPISSLDELLLIPGVTTELLYGADRNHNGIVDANEQAAAGAGAEGSMARGWSAYLTVNSKDYFQQGEEPVDLNQDDLETLYEEVLSAGFDEDLATYIVAYRQGGPYQLPEIEESEDPDQPPPELPEPQPISGLTPKFDVGATAEFTSVLDLISSMTEAEFEGGETGGGETGGGGQGGGGEGGGGQGGGGQGGQGATKTVVMSPLDESSNLSDLLPQMMSSFVAGEIEGTGRINSNHCSSSVISGLPGMDEATAQSILFAQDAGEVSGDLNYLYPTWPLAVGAVTVDQMKALLPYVSGSGAIFRAQVVAYSDEPGQYARAEVIIDASGDAPRVLSLRDLSHLGPGFSLDTLSQ